MAQVETAKKKLCKSPTECTLSWVSSTTSIQKIGRFPEKKKIGAGAFLPNVFVPPRKCILPKKASKAARS